jgi:5-methylcytosine-specific restriction endonuclease McrA
MKCLKCNTEHNGLFGSGKFCSRSCSNSRIRTSETKEKIANGVKEAIVSGKAKKPNRKGVKLPPRTQEHSAKISEGRNAYWDKKGRVSEEHKRAGNKANVYAYRARKRNAIPDNADLNLIRQIYQFVPEGYQVDHKIPLSRGGLHHQDNLQYLPAKDNQSKNNRLDYDSKNAIQWQEVLVATVV